MPIYNGINFINESVSSILYQTYHKWELIIGINGHSQNSNIYKEAKKWENRDTRIKVFDLYTINNKSDALNEMIKYCKYDWICLLDVDDKWLPNKLEKQVLFMNTYDVIGGQCKYFGDLNITPQIPINDITNFNFFAVNPIINSSCLLKKKYCFWNKEWDGVEDYDLWLKLWTQNKTFYNVNDIIILHRIHENSAFNAKGNNLKVKKLKQYYSTFNKK